MKTLFIFYIIIVNLTGFFIMGIDKRRAIKGKWRIRERTLFLIALAFGSVGILVGMYVFRHKTKHLIFTIGIPVILVLQMLLTVFLYSWHHMQMARPSQTVENELSLISQLDSDTIRSFISYENLINSDLSSSTIDDEAAQAVRLFFQNFKYHIHNEQIDGDTATVSVSITNLDTHALAQDLCRAILKESVALYPDAQAPDSGDYYHLLYETLRNNSYDLVTTTAYFRLQQDESGWVILSDLTLEDELTSGFISYINDPYILPAAEVLSIHLDAFMDLTADQWADYLSLEDVFATYNTEYYPLIDAEYLSQLTSAFSYQILKCQEENNTASAVVRITSIDMPSVLSRYRTYLLDYAASAKAVRDDAVTFSDTTAGLLLQALKENTATASTDVEVSMVNCGSVWDVEYDSAFTDAVMGNMTEAIQTFNASVPDVQEQLIEPRY